MQRSLESTCHCLDGLEVSVVVREHPKWGEHPHPMAFVILHRERAQHWVGKHIELAPELKAHTRERLPGFAVLEWSLLSRSCQCVTSLVHSCVLTGDITRQKTTTGKIQKTV